MRKHMYTHENQERVVVVISIGYSFNGKFLEDERKREKDERDFS